MRDRHGASRAGAHARLRPPQAFHASSGRHRAPGPRHCVRRQTVARRGRRPHVCAVTDAPKKPGLFGLFRRGATEAKPVTAEARPQPPPAAPSAQVERAPPAEAEGAPAATEPARAETWFQRLKAGLTKSSNRLSQNNEGIYTMQKLGVAKHAELRQQ